ncbi:Molybdopterin binding protein [Yamadazyma tenuis ATCC 10573]|nr:Molybdopterin binding protein [Yamadazyma tenuis ATCC 10573]EGV62508.1 Molybdopterin binding protein [Yamadazyma tenuis ATCC 10573]
MVNPIRKAGCLIIGDEVLNGKILDTNSHVFAKFCFNELSIPVKKTIVCGDDCDDITNSLNTLIHDDCDFIVTSGGIGPTHDDITYESIAHAFGVECKRDQQTVDRMHSLRTEYLTTLTDRRLAAFYRMATFPVASDTVSVDKIYTDDSLWVPVVGINSQVYILPGVPQLFEKLLLGLKDSLKRRVDVDSRLKRFYVKTTTKESELAPFLADLQSSSNATYGAGSVKLGSYPHFAWGVNTISVIGDKHVSVEALRVIVADVVGNLGGEAREISVEEEETMTTTSPQK